MFIVNTLNEMFINHIFIISMFQVRVDEQNINLYQLFDAVHVYECKIPLNIFKSTNIIRYQFSRFKTCGEIEG